MFESFWTTRVVVYSTLLIILICITEKRDSGSSSASQSSSSSSLFVSSTPTEEPSNGTHSDNYRLLHKLFPPPESPSPRSAEKEEKDVVGTEEEAKGHNGLTGDNRQQQSQNKQPISPFVTIDDTHLHSEKITQNQQHFVISNTTETITSLQYIYNNVLNNHNLSSNSNDSNTYIRVRRNQQDTYQDCDNSVSRKPTIYGLRCDHAEVADDGAIIIMASKPTKVYLIGRHLYTNLSVALTSIEGSPQDDCTHTDRVKTLQLTHISSNIAEVIVDVPSPAKIIPYYICLREYVDTNWFHQGSDPWLKIYVKQDFMPLYLKFISIFILLILSGLFSGLNLGLMALDKNELQVIMKCGTTEEKQYARIIEPLRRRGNYLLCSILFSNTLVNSTISIIMEGISDGVIAVIVSTILIVMFGEILPQAFCSRHGLAVGAKTIWLTRICMLVTFPLSYPVSFFLDRALGEEIGHAYDRERLAEFIQVTRDINNLEADEVNIITGALKIKRVPISEVMTPIDDVYMLNENAVLDFDTIQTIVGNGFSRIPIHDENNKKNIKAVLFAKDLALVDPDDRTPVQTMINFYNHPLMVVFEDAKLDQVLNEFKTGKSHLAIVQKVIDDGERDPIYEVTGIVTLEDVIEEILAMEINDETDTLTDNRKKRRRDANLVQVRSDLSDFTNLGSGDSSHNVRVTPQLCLAAYQYLATSVDPFSPDYLSDSILKRLLSQKIFYKVRMEDDDSKKRLYTAGEPADYFIMILEGRVHVICGKENLVFDGGPFSFFGRAALANFDETVNTSSSNAADTATGKAQSTGSRRASSIKPPMSRRESIARIVTAQLPIPGVSSSSSKKAPDAIEMTNSPNHSGDITSELVEMDESGICFFRPDYTVDIITNTSYLKVTRKDYLTALKATQIERASSRIDRINSGNELTAEVHDCAGSDSSKNFSPYD